MKNLKVEFGNKATDWTPAPEDVQAEIDGLGSRLSTAETSITQLAGQIELRATKTEVDELTGRVSTVESTIRQHADMIESKIDAGDARSIFRQEASSFTFDADQINFKGHVFGEDATFTGRLEGASGSFSGDISGSFVRGEGISLYSEEPFLINYSSYLQPDSFSIHYQDDRGIVKVTSLGNSRLKHEYLLSDGGDASFTFEMESALFTGGVFVSEGLTSANEVTAGGFSGYIRLRPGNNHGHIEFYRTGERVAYIGIPSADSEDFDISPYGVTGQLRLRGRNVLIEQRLINPQAYNVTTQSPANVYVATNGYFARSTSSKRYKADIRYNDVDYKRILKLQQASWVDRNEFEKNNMSAEGLKRYYGAIAEDFERIGLSEYVVYNEETGEVENFSDRAWVLLIPNINDILRELEQIKERLERLENESSV